MYDGLALLEGHKYWRYNGGGCTEIDEVVESVDQTLGHDAHREPRGFRHYVASVIVSVVPRGRCISVQTHPSHLRSDGVRFQVFHYTAGSLREYMICESLSKHDVITV